MADIVLEFDHIWKKFRKGEQRHDSLRDLIPALVKRLYQPRREKDLKGQEFWAIRDVSFQVGKGEALGIVGPPNPSSVSPDPSSSSPGRPIAHTSSLILLEGPTLRAARPPAC